MNNADLRRVSCNEARFDMMEADRILLTVAQQLGSFRQVWVTAGPEAHMAAVDGYRTDLPSERRSVLGSDCTANQGWHEALQREDLHMDGDLLSHRTNKGQHQADKMSANHQQHNKEHV